MPCVVRASAPHGGAHDEVVNDLSRLRGNTSRQMANIIILADDMDRLRMELQDMSCHGLRGD